MKERYQNIALPLTPENLAEAFLSSPVFGPQLRIGRLQDEHTVVVPHFFGVPSREPVSYKGETPPREGNRVVVFSL